MNWLILGILAAATVVLSGGVSEAATGEDNKDKPTADTAKEFDEGRTAGVRDAEASIALVEKSGGVPMPMVTSSFDAAWVGTARDLGYQSGFRATLLSTKPFYELDSESWSTTAKVRRIASPEVEEKRGALARFDLGVATVDNPLRGYLSPPKSFSGRPAVAFVDQMIDRADYFWDYLRSLEPVADHLVAMSAKNPVEAEKHKKIVDVLIQEDFRVVLGPLASYVESNTSDLTGAASDAGRLALASQVTTGPDLDQTILAIRALLGNAGGEGWIGADDVRIQAVQNAVAYGVPFNLVTTGGAEGQTRYYYGDLGDACTPMGLCSLIASFTGAGFPEAQASRAKDGFSFLKFYVKDDPISASAYTTAAYFPQNWLATAPTTTELSKVVGEGIYYYRKFYECIVTALGIAAAARAAVPPYLWTEVVAEAWKGWDGGVEGARKSGYGWPGASGVAFAFDFATRAATVLGTQIMPTE